MQRILFAQSRVRLPGGRPRSLLVIAAVVAVLATACQPGWTQPMAGTGNANTAGNAEPASTTVFQAPGAVTPIPGGGFYVVDTSTCQIHKVDAAGVDTTVAGTVCGHAGDGGPATAAKISPCLPGGLALDGAGSLWFSTLDPSSSGPFPSCVLRRIDASGTLTTPAIGAPADIGNVARAADGTVYFPYPNANNTTAVRHIDLSGTITDAAVVAGNFNTVTVASPTGLLLGAMGTISRLDLTTNAVTATGISGSFLTVPTVGVDGSVYWDGGHSRVLRTAPDGTVTVVAGSGTPDPGTGLQSGPALNLAFSPSGLAIGADGALLLSSGHTVYRVELVASVYGDAGPATKAPLQAPGAVTAIPSGGFYVADSTTCVIRKIDAAGIISTVAGTGTCSFSGDGGPATAAGIGSVHALAVDGAGNLWIAGRSAYSLQGLRRIGTDGVITSPDVGQLDDLSHSWPIAGLTAGSDGTVYFTKKVPDDGVTPNNEWTVNSISSVGALGTVTTFATSLTPAGIASISPSKFAITGTLTNGGVYRLDAAVLPVALTDTGARTTWTAGSSLAATSDGTIYAPNLNDTRVQRINPNNTVSLIAGNGTPDLGVGSQQGMGTSLKLSPQGLALTPNNGLLISSGHVVYRLERPALAS